MDEILKFEALVVSAKEEADKFYNKNNKAAGTRLRAKMQEIKNLATDIRRNVSDVKNS